MNKTRGLNDSSLFSICICCDFDLNGGHGGADRVKNLAVNVSKRPVRVIIMDRVTKKSFSSMISDKDKYYELKNGVLIEYEYPFIITFFFPGIIKLLQDCFTKMFSFFSRSPQSEISIFRIFDPYLFVKLFYLVKKEGINLIQAELPQTTFISSLLKKLFNIPIIYDAHNVESVRVLEAGVKPLLASIIKKVEMNACKICDLIFSVSENDKQLFIKLGVSSNKIKVISNSVNPENFLIENGIKIRQKYNLTDKFVLIFHGALMYPPNRQAIKILTNFILPTIQEKNPSVVLLLVGGSPPKIANKNVIATGYVENLPEYLAAADVGVVPLLNGGGTRIKILEYMASGLPVISTFKGAEGLTLENGLEILMTEHPDSEFIKLLLGIIKNAELRKNIGFNARKKVEALYDWKQTGGKAFVAYQSLLDQ